MGRRIGRTAVRLTHEALPIDAVSRLQDALLKLGANMRIWKELARLLQESYLRFRPKLQECFINSRVPSRLKGQWHYDTVPGHAILSPSIICIAHYADILQPVSGIAWVVLEEILCRWNGILERTKELTRERTIEDVRH